jgi:hypothetical protein
MSLLLDKTRSKSVSEKVGMKVSRRNLASGALREVVM